MKDFPRRVVDEAFERVAGGGALTNLDRDNDGETRGDVRLQIIDSSMGSGELASLGAKLQKLDTGGELAGFGNHKALSCM